MSKINILESAVYNRIAAGEVVERPASVVKELIENSIDAGAKNITIEVKEGGIKQIKVTDDGSGIENEFVKTAFLPHATSKISSVDDLEKIFTLGFRGEALASIASVSMITLKTKTFDAETGTLIELKDGEIANFTECAINTGSVFCVDNLFYNTPARAKFLKSKKGEEAEITNTVLRFILANPNICFKYSADEKTVFDFIGNGLLGALAEVYGKEIIGNVIEVEYKKNGYELTGFICKPDFAKPNRTYQTLIINGRIITNSLISTAVYNAYGNFLMTRRYPLFALNLKMPYDMLDVNVHPNKFDVRFQENNHIYGIFYNTVFNALTNSLNKNIFQEENFKEEPAASFVKPAFSATPEFKSASGFEKPKVVFNVPDFSYDFKKEEIKDLKVSDSEIQPVQSESVQEQVLNAEQTVFNLPKEQLKIIGTLFNVYIVAENNKEMFLIDQHAAAERLLFDKLKTSIDSKDLAVQTLMLPYILSVNSSEAVLIEENLPHFGALGFNIEQFGNNSFKISEIPMILSNLNFDKFFNNLLIEDVNLKYIKASDIIKEKLMQAACKAAVKAGDTLNGMEIEGLIEQINSGVVLLCPHGRPIVVKYSKTEIDKWFKRIV